MLLPYSKGIAAWFIVFLIAITNNVIAKPHYSERYIALGHSYLGVIAGASIASLGKEQTDTTASSSGTNRKYTYTDRASSAILYGINGGYEFEIEPNMLWSLGLGIYQGLNYSLKGQELVVSSLSSNSKYYADYTYHVCSTRLMLETQLAWEIFFSYRTKFIPFVFVGAGPALNYANSYQDTLIDSSAAGYPSFKSKSKISFAYQLGVGIAYPFNLDNSRLSISYRYVDLGTARFGDRSSDSVYRLDTGRIRANEIFIGYTHLFNF